MKKTFKILRAGDKEKLKEILDLKPEEIYAVAKQPPKKDDGQSLLQVALKTGQLETADMLLDYHADVNFIESEDCCNEWRIPVIHDAIRCAIMKCRWNSKKYGTDEYELHSTKEEAENAYLILKRMFDMGADINGKDSYGNSTLERAVMDAVQILPQYSYSEDRIYSDHFKLTAALREDLSKIFRLLYDNGASISWQTRDGKTIREIWSRGPIVEFLELDNLED